MAGMGKGKGRPSGARPPMLRSRSRSEAELSVMRNRPHDSPASRSTVMPILPTSPVSAWAMPSIALKADTVPVISITNLPPGTSKAESRSVFLPCGPIKTTAVRTSHVNAKLTVVNRRAAARRPRMREDPENGRAGRPFASRCARSGHSPPSRTRTLCSTEETGNDANCDVEPDEDANTIEADEDNDVGSVE
ncbi:hypothetical protein FA95DRAFT_1610142 [Auriscalpium vulgare]|uniref:Uncharacterized protein n=1 Tax=Auriscalpium vulgare TaxID=40419 RepID=A0ACB8REH9_9AGAM|nr:hypothetical protein FA95DRAFT_1610142 [Auriscalpium vulgare]